MMGGAAKILARGRELHDAGKYLLATEIVNKLVQAEPQNTEAAELLADSFEQLGYQQENPGLRNSFLAAAYELRTGIPQGQGGKLEQPRCHPGDVDGTLPQLPRHPHGQPQGRGHALYDQLVTPDNGEKFIVELKNATLTNIKGFQAANPDLTLTINRADLEQTMMGAKTLDAQITDGTAKTVGDVGILKRLAAIMVDFDPRFEIMPGTKARTADTDAFVESGVPDKGDPYQAVPRQSIAE